MIDSNNCGSCGNVCAAGEVCSNAYCAKEICVNDSTRYTISELITQKLLWISGRITLADMIRVVKLWKYC